MNSPITKAQRKALFRVWQRTQWEYDDGNHEKMTYRKFRRTVVHAHDCIMVHFAGMWLGIEYDGYTHS